MTTREDVIPTSKNWADDIDELKRDAMERCLQRTFCSHTWARVSKDGVAEEKVSAAVSDKKGS